MLGLDPSTHVLDAVRERKAWMPGTGAGHDDKKICVHLRHLRIDLYRACATFHLMMRPSAMLMAEKNSNASAEPMATLA